MKKAHFDLTCYNRAGQCRPCLVESQENWGGELLSPHSPLGTKPPPHLQTGAGRGQWVQRAAKSLRKYQRGGGSEGGLDAGRLIDEKTSRLVQPAPEPQESISYWASPPVSMATQFGAL